MYIYMPKKFNVRFGKHKTMGNFFRYPNKEIKEKIFKTESINFS